MTEGDWLAATDPGGMLEFLEGQASDRKLRLFAVACCRRIWDVLTDEACRNAVDVAERFADGEATAEELGLAADAACDRHTELEEELDELDVHPADKLRLFNAMEAALETAGHFRYGLGSICENLDWARGKNETEYPALCELVRDVFGTLPFRIIDADPSWLTPSVVSLARLMYDDRDFSPMPILADALQDAGCDRAEIRSHCHGPGPHVKGCWVVDLVLGRE